MTGIEWLVVLGALCAIAWVNGYFFPRGRIAKDDGESEG